MTSISPNRKAILLATGAAAGVLALLGTTAWFAFAPRGDDQFAECRATQIAGGAGAIGGEFSLLDQTGQRVSAAEVITGPTLVYFGYTFCPDVCPLDTARNAAAVDLLADEGLNVTPVFITIDPGRDTPATLAEYAHWIHPDMVALTGTQAEVDVAIRAYRAYGAKSGDGPDYLMNHSTFTYLMAPEHGFLEFFRRDLSAEALAQSVSCFVGDLG